MKSRQFIWLLLFSTALNLNAFTLTSNDIESTTTKKVFVLIRSEQNQQQLDRFKQQINDDLRLQNLSVQIETYRRSEPLPQTKIFKTAYSGDYDMLLLIEQIAKYSIDNRVTNSIIKMGGKYKIRSYNLKEKPYTWIDHGDSNCNISVDMSLKAFTGKLLASIDIKQAKGINVADYNNTLATALSPSTNSKSTMSGELLLYYDLLNQIKTQKKKTRVLLYKIQQLRDKLKSSSNLPQDFAQLKLD